MTDTKITLGTRVRVVKAEHEGWTPDDMRVGDEGSITREWRRGDIVDFLRDDGRKYGGLVVGRFEVIDEEKTRDAVNYKYAFSAELRGRNTVQTDGLVILNPPPKVCVSVIATGYDEAIETAFGVLPDFSKMSFDWALDVTSIEVQA